MKMCVIDVARSGKRSTGERDYKVMKRPPSLIPIQLISGNAEHASPLRCIHPHCHFVIFSKLQVFNKVLRLKKKGMKYRTIYSEELRYLYRPVSAEATVG
jgi:hypothetical protein